ncbi:myb family transcription factor PHL8 isoform X1 [Eutrema salsugineum]|uniref:myb family transcription factor PHL8 isoform X1 n=1 Tax=Eutrema salsugineum TaxID=72664 RepID=UPI000CED1F75|nr:myb family transcription factor PHL8 isoform X1 [Eutrema salsugineum]XP_024008178.1 myb family transcription factor PHL8 isoform X1 [Eutrema salsugineum]
MGNDHKARDTKPRLRWSCELHHRFIDAVNQLGGPNKATPKGLMGIMEIPELTLYHFKSHLQKYRLGISDRFVGKKQDVSSAAKSQECQSQKDFGDQIDIIVTEEKDDQPSKNLQIKEAIEIQLEVQKKLHEQFEVQRQLQVRIETHRKYLQSVFMKAQETLSGYKSLNLVIDDLYGEASMENRSCVSSCFSGLTQADEEGGEIEEEERFLRSKKSENRGIEPSRSSVDRSLTSSESSNIKNEFDFQSVTRRSNELQLMEIKPVEVIERKKRRWNDVFCGEQPLRKRASGSEDGEDLGLSLNSFKDVETYSKSN